jgi:hypothetical protein
MNSNSKCVILVPVFGGIEKETEALLAECQRMDYPVETLFGNAYIDKARSIMASRVLDDGYEEIMWIDQDMTFNPDSIEVLRSHGLPIIGAVYPTKSRKGGLCGCLLKGCGKLTFGPKGGLAEIRWAATGFLYTKREVYDKIGETFDFPICDNEDGDGQFFPYFFPMIYRNGAVHNYLGEDYSFCERARQCGYKIYADTTIRLGHIGKYRYSWEDIAGDRPRAQTFELEWE